MATLAEIRLGSLAEYPLLPRDDGSPAWVFPNSFDILADTGFWLADRTHRLGGKFGNVMISTALKSGLYFSSSTDGEQPKRRPASGKSLSSVLNSWIINGGGELNLSFANAPSKDDKRICRAEVRGELVLGAKRVLRTLYDSNEGPALGDTRKTG